MEQTERAAPVTYLIPTAMRAAFETAMDKAWGRIYSSSEEPVYFHIQRRVDSSRLGYVKRSEKWPKPRRKKASS